MSNGFTDFNDAGSQLDGLDRQKLERILRQLAPLWIPGEFPNGKETRERGVRCWRVGNVNGDRAHGDGSCRLILDGPNAGDWCDFDDRNRKKGQVFSTIKQRFALEPAQVYAVARELIAKYGGTDYLTGKARLPNGAANGNIVARCATDTERNVQHANQLLDQCVRLPGSIGHRYLQNRGIANLPPVAYGPTADLLNADGRPDLLYHDAATHSDTRRGHPTIIARFRYPEGSLTGGIHRIYLEDDGSWHLGRRGIEAKKMLGPTQGGVIMLAPIGSKGELGIGEGIETTLAGMQQYGAPGWAAADAGNMERLALWLRSHGGKAAEIKHLLLWLDNDPTGKRAGAALAAAAREVGIEVECYLPASGDDFAKDVELGLPPSPPIASPDGLMDAVPLLPASPTAPVDSAHTEPSTAAIGRAAPTMLERAQTADRPRLGLDALSSRIMALQKGIVSEELSAICAAIADANLDAVNQEQLVNLLARRTGVKKKAIEEIVRARQLEQRGHEPESAPRAWLSKAVTNELGEPKGIMANVAMALREDPEWRGCLCFNEFTGMIWLSREPPYSKNAGKPCDRSWTDDDELATTEWIQIVASIHAPNNVVFQAVQRVAAETRYHPVREYLDTLAWDGKPRLDTWTTYYLGADDTSYHRAVGARFLVSAVARIYRPGCKADCMTILEGPQGIGKSTAIRILAEPWFTDELAQVGTKDASLALQGVWLIELSELDSMSRAEIKTIKSFMSRTTDRFRPPYGRMPITVERQCVFCGSCNETEYLKDATGGRRFWPIRCISIDRDALWHDRDQLWAEAVARFKTGGAHAKWWIDEPELISAANEEQKARYREDVWQDAIARFIDADPISGDNAIIRAMVFKRFGIPDAQLTSRDWQRRLPPVVTVAEILNHLGIPERDQDQRSANRVVECLQALDWKRDRLRVKGKSKWIYHPANVPIVPGDDE